MQCAAAFCYHHTDRPYIVPEGVIIHGSRRFWYRNSDLGNGVQQAETIKNARLVIGIDDISKNRGLRLVPRMPHTWNKIEAQDYPVCAGGKKLDVNFTYQRDGEGYQMSLACPEPLEVDFVRFGPFAENKTVFSVSGAKNYSVKTINGRNFVYVPVGEKTKSLAISVK